MVRIFALSAALSVFVLSCTPYPSVNVVSTKQFPDGSYLVAVEKTNISKSLERNQYASERAEKMAVDNICPIGGTAVRVNPAGKPLDKSAETYVALETILAICTSCSEGLATKTFFKVTCNEGAPTNG